jgi:hypothetical protein
MGPCRAACAPSVHERHLLWRVEVPLYAGGDWRSIPVSEEGATGQQGSSADRCRMAIHGLSRYVTRWPLKVSAVLKEGEPGRMFVRCSHLNVSPFSGRVSRTAPICSGNPSRNAATFVSRHHEVFEPLQLGKVGIADWFYLSRLDYRYWRSSMSQPTTPASRELVLYRCADGRPGCRCCTWPKF